MKSSIILFLIVCFLVLGCKAQKIKTKLSFQIDSLVIQYYAFTSKTNIPLDEEYLSKIKNNGKSFGKTILQKNDEVSNLYSLLSKKFSDNVDCQTEDFRMLMSFYSNGKPDFFLLDKSMILSNNLRCVKLDTISQKKLFQIICKPKFSEVNVDEKKIWRYSKICR